MRSFLGKLKPRAEADCQSDDENDKPQNPRHEKVARTRARTVKSTAHPAACRGLYAVPMKPRRIKSHSTQVKQLNLVREGDDPDDPIIKHSMYPQMNGKRRSEVEAEIRTRMTKYDRASTGEDCLEHTAHHGRAVHCQYTARRARTHSVDCDSSSDSDSDYSSDGNPDGRPIRVCIYPQAKYIKELVQTPFSPQQALVGFVSSSSIEPLTPRTPSYRNWKRSRLPGDEYQILRRRQVMQRAREVLKPHFAQRSSAPKKGLVGHGETQSFSEYHTERRRISRMQYAVRKAMQADLNPFSDDFNLAMTRHAEKICFCELSDVNGVPIDEKLMWDFIRMYRKARDEAYEPKDSKEAMVRPFQPVQRISVDERNDRLRQATLRRVDSGATMRAPVQRPVLVSRFSCDNSDGEVEMPKRLAKTKLQDNRNPGNNPS